MLFDRDEDFIGHEDTLYNVDYIFFKRIVRRLALIGLEGIGYVIIFNRI